MKMETSHFHKLKDVQVLHKNVERAHYRRSEKDEDSSSKCEQEQELEDRWMVGSKLMLCL